MGGRGEPIRVEMVVFCWPVLDELEGLEVRAGSVVALEEQRAGFDTGDDRVGWGKCGGLGGAADTVVVVLAVPVVGDAAADKRVFPASGGG